MVNIVERLSAAWADHRARRARRAYYGACAACGHDWREHIPGEGCGECQYEIEHEEQGAPTTRCTAPAPGYTF
jgi:hypothetical protein